MLATAPTSPRRRPARPAAPTWRIPSSGRRAGPGPPSTSACWTCRCPGPGGPGDRLTALADLGDGGPGPRPAGRGPRRRGRDRAPTSGPTAGRRPVGRVGGKPARRPPAGPPGRRRLAARRHQAVVQRRRAAATTPWSPRRSRRRVPAVRRRPGRPRRAAGRRHLAGGRDAGQRQPVGAVRRGTRRRGRRPAGVPASRPGFWHGAVGVAAVWWGGARGVGAGAGAGRRVAGRWARTRWRTPARSTPR